MFVFAPDDWNQRQGKSAPLGARDEANAGLGGVISWWRMPGVTCVANISIGSGSGIGVARSQRNRWPGTADKSNFRLVYSFCLSVIFFFLKINWYLYGIKWTYTSCASEHRRRKRSDADVVLHITVLDGGRFVPVTLFAFVPASTANRRIFYLCW